MPTNPNGHILITGGTGYIARAILTVAEEEGWDARFTVLSRDDAKQRVIRERFEHVQCVLGDVRDLESLERNFSGKDLIIHAAALKFIPQAEANPDEAIAVNVLGSQNVCRAAVRTGVPKVLGISTDKAVSPHNIYGMTKAMMERIFTDYNKLGKTHFALVRYGNVVGSTGSVIPLFQQQHREGKTLTLTDPTMTRFWLSYREAIEVIKLGLEAPRFANIIPKCRGMSLWALAHAINEGASTVTIGARPGEKRHEELLGALESHNARETEDYYRLWLGSLGEQQYLTQFNGGNELPAGFFYRSDLAHVLSGENMLKMITEAEAI